MSNLTPNKFASLIQLAETILNSKKGHVWTALIAAALAAIAFFASCQTSPVVSAVEFNGNGAILTDGNHVVATGDFEGSVQVAIKGSAVPIYYFPIVAGDGLIWCAVLSTGETGLYEVDELPPWVLSFLPLPD